MGNTIDDLIAPPPRGLAFLQKTYVAGVQYYAFFKRDLPLDVGMTVELRREPDNDFDPRAIAVHTPDDLKLGYVPKKQNKYPCRLLDAGLRLPARLEKVQSPERFDESPRHVPHRLDIAIFVERGTCEHPS